MNAQYSEQLINNSVQKGNNMAKKFPMGAWVYNPITDFTPDEVDVWADMGLTVTMCGTVKYDEAELVLPFLDRAKERDIKLIAWVSGIGNPRSDEAGYKARFKELYENKLKKHPALYGFFIGDEPGNPDAVEYVIAEMKAQKEVAPELHPYINLMGSTYSRRNIFPGKTYPEFITDFKERTACESFCFDIYDQTINDGGVTNFYATLKAQNEAANAAGIDCWATLLSSAHWSYRIPTEYQFMWAISHSAALGCKGIMWFRLYDREIAPEYHGSPIDEFGFKTEQYNKLMRCQKRFQEHFGEIMLGLHWKKAYLTGFPRMSYTMFNEYCHDVIKSIDVFERGVISFFEDDNGNEYFALVNAEMVQPTHFDFVYDNTKANIVELERNGKVESRVGRRYATADLYPGQMLLFRIDRK